MRYLTLLVILYISQSCQKNKDKKNDLDLLYSLDTVIIDSKGKLLDLTRYILISDFDNEKASIFLYNGFDHSIDEVSLEKLKVVNNYSFDAEGPNGTGGNFYSLNLLNDSLFFIKSFYSSAIFDKNGRIVKKIDWFNSIDSNGLKYENIPTNEILVCAKNDLKAYGLSYNNKNREVFLDALSVQDNSVNRLDIDSKKTYSDLILEVKDPDGDFFVNPYVDIKSENNLIIISHEFSNQIALFNPKGEFVKTVNYDPELTPKRVKEIDSSSITTIEQVEKEYQNYLEQVKFYHPVWDNQKERYLRLSTRRIFLDRKEEDEFLPETLNTKTYLSVFDIEFNLISESEISELSYKWGKYFAKDGKLWIFQNFSDELGFIIIDI
ncbi:DUF4221 family protein [Pleomorphovibrio marinus]|uniref:DUF4221 family protein n=1 Tax=Pleomorphovibrio marinus TaxID=2164132 RepID=UPI000E0B9612|nr:DUF4221 family protein [Pleomorphovibrio marinus]